MHARLEVLERGTEAWKAGYIIMSVMSNED